ncbi:MAG: hypothetical protein GY862_08995 [Gammaproteobacteria bacterium]|nr:hypothetical protein [Gammaproteobacteria bacterium]
MCNCKKLKLWSICCLAALAVLINCRPVLAALIFEPAAPKAEAGTRINLSVSGAVGMAVWGALKGEIQGFGNQVVYTAPRQAGMDVLTVLDGNDTIGILSITVLPASEVSVEILPENAVWEVFTNRSRVRALALSENGKILWAGTEGGLEQRDAKNGRLLRVFRNLDGLPHSHVNALLIDGKGALWVGTREGLAQRDKTGEWSIHSRELPHNWVNSLLADGNGGLWAGTGFNDGGGLAHRDAEGNWQTFIQADSGLPHDWINALLIDGNGDLWAGTNGGGLARRSANGEWTVFNTQNSDLPSDYVIALLNDGSGGLWAGTNRLNNSAGGLARFSAAGEWRVYHEGDNGLPGDDIIILLADGAGSLWLSTANGLARGNANTGWELADLAQIGITGGAHRQINALLLDGGDGLWAAIGGYDGGGIAYYKAGEWNLLPADDAGMPDNAVNLLLADGSGGQWIATGAGIAHHSAAGEWTLFDPTNSALPDGNISSLDIDAGGDLWAGTQGGVVRRDVNGVWSVFNMENAPLPNNEVSAVASDAAGGLWAGLTKFYDGAGGLAYHDAGGAWQVFNTGNSPLPGNDITALLTDSGDGVWIGANSYEEGVTGGLAYRDAGGAWQVYTMDNAPLPSNYILSLLADGNGGLWTGTEAGIVRRSAGGEWSSFPENTAIVTDWHIHSLLAAGKDGLWMGTIQGLVYRNAFGEWQVFNAENSGLPDNTVSALLADGTGGLWAGTLYGGLAHLGFGRKSALLETIQDEGHQDILLRGRRAAIIIHPRGQGSGYNQESAIDFMAGYAYHTLYARGYDNDEIYFLSHKPDLDFNGDATADANLVDAPLTLAELKAGASSRDLSLADVEAAFAWAAKKGPLDQPLIVIFVDHGLPDGLLLDPLGREILSADLLSARLDNYQAATGNQAAVLLEACHTGALLPGLSGPGRLIISSTDEGLAYYDDLGRTSFLKLYLDELRQGDTFQQAFATVTQTLAGYRWPFNRQRPQWNDMMGTPRLCLNGCFGGLPGVLTLTVQTSSAAVIEPGGSVELDVQTHAVGGSVRSVWASVLTPEVAAQRTAYGYSQLPTPVTYLRKTTDNRWQGNFSEFSTRGEYAITVKARDNTGFVTEAAPVTLLAEQGPAITHAHFDLDTGTLHLPAVTVPDSEGGTELFQIELVLSSADPLALELSSAAPAEDAASVSFANFIPAAGTIYVPVLDVPNASGGIDEYSINLLFVPGSSPLRFALGMPEK